MDPRFLKEQGTGIFTGNELIVKGALESGVGEITGYPGSPLAELFDTLESIRDLLNEHGIAAQIANNEALAAARLNGSQMADVRAMAVMKSVISPITDKKNNHDVALFYIGHRDRSLSTKNPEIW